MHRIIGNAILLSVVACGGRPPPFPDVAGIYNMTASCDGQTEKECHFTGTLTLNQSARTIETLSGTLSLVGMFSGETFSFSTAPLSQTQTSTSGVISFLVRNPAGTWWTFTGQKSGSGIINGRHSALGQPGEPTVSGSWQASKQ
jgi:hypothetical protein